MGLLDGDFFGSGFEDPRSAAIMAVSAGLLNRNLGGGLLAANTAFSSAQDAKIKRGLLEAQVEENKQQARERAMKIAAAEAEAKRVSGFQAGLPSLLRQAGFTNGAIQPQTESGLPMFSRPVGVGAVQATPGGFDSIRALTEFRMKPKEVEEYAAAMNAGRPEVARTMETMRNGRPVTLQFDKFGNPVGQAEEQWKAPIMQNLGNRVAAIDPVGLGERGSFKTAMSDAERDAASRGWAGHGLAQKRFQHEQTQAMQPTLVDGQWVYKPTMANPQGAAQPVAGFNKQGNLSEGERKSATLLQRLEGSQKQLTAALSDAPGAAKPELTAAAIRGFKLPVVGGIPGADALANTVTSEPRQQVEAAQLDMLDAALTLGTGAAYTKEQLEGYRKSYFPQIGDDAKTVKDKQDRLNNVINAARLAAGRAANLTGQKPNATPDMDDPLGLRR